MPKFEKPTPSELDHLCRFYFLDWFSEYRIAELTDDLDGLIGHGRTRQEVITSIVAYMARDDFYRNRFAYDSLLGMLRQLRREKKLTPEIRALIAQELALSYEQTLTYDKQLQRKREAAEREQRLSVPLQFADGSGVTEMRHTVGSEQGLLSRLLKSRRPVQVVGGRIPPNDPDGYDIRVTPPLFRQAQAVMQQLIEHFEKAGHKVITKRTRRGMETVAVIGKAEIELQLREKLKCIRFPETDEYRAAMDWQPQGTLTVRVGRMRQAYDLPADEPLEAHLDKVVQMAAKSKW